MLLTTITKYSNQSIHLKKRPIRPENNDNLQQHTTNVSLYI